MTDNSDAFIDDKLWKIKDIPFRLKGMARLQTRANFKSEQIAFTVNQDTRIYMGWD